MAPELPHGFQSTQPPPGPRPWAILTALGVILGIPIIWFMWQAGVFGPDACEELDERCRKARVSTLWPEELRACAIVDNTFQQMREKDEKITRLTCMGMIEALDGAREGRLDEYIVHDDEPPPEPAWDDEPPPPPAPAVEPSIGGTLCGSDGALFDVTASRPADWSRWTCAGPGDAGSRWARCLSRSSYSPVPQTGCPGDTRCCPPI